LEPELAEGLRFSTGAALATAALSTTVPARAVIVFQLIRIVTSIEFGAHISTTRLQASIVTYYRGACSSGAKMSRESAEIAR
jgi:hypothetical protein